jgi:hypothetical protein
MQVHFLWESVVLLLQKNSVASQSASGLYRQSDRRRSAKLLPTLAGKGVLRGQRYDYYNVL